MEIPEAAFAALAEEFQDGVSVVLHSWTTDSGSVHTVVATSPEDAFDEGEDAFDVDRVAISMVTLRRGPDDETWNLEIDSDIGLADLFSNLVDAYYEEMPGDEESAP